MILRTALQRLFQAAGAATACLIAMLQQGQIETAVQNKPGAGATLWGERVLPADLGTACCPGGTNLLLDLRSNVCCFVSSVK
jgi:hypothetical protein